MRVDAHPHVKTYLNSIYRILWVAGVKRNPDYTALTFSLLIPKCRRLAGWLVRTRWERDKGLRPWAASPCMAKSRSVPSGLAEARVSAGTGAGQRHLFSPSAELGAACSWEFQIPCAICRASQETWEGITAYGDLWY